MLHETAEETLLEVDRNCLTMVKTNGLNSLTETDDRDGSKDRERSKGDSLVVATTK